jgi:uncharacterized protein YbcI
VHTRDEPALRAEVAKAISSSAVGLLARHTGRGPSTARTHVRPELVTVLLWDTMTSGERSLLRAGRGEVVLAVRQAHHESLGAELISAVEGHTGQRVLAFLSDSHLEPDIAIGVFVLARPADRDVSAAAASR